MNTKATKAAAARAKAAAEVVKHLQAVAEMATSIALVAARDAETAERAGTDRPNIYGDLGDAQDLSAKLVALLAAREPVYATDEEAARAAVRRRFGLK